MSGDLTRNEVVSVFIRIGLASIVTYYSMKQVKNSEK
jgi:hypothetical protein